MSVTDITGTTPAAYGVGSAKPAPAKSPDASARGAATAGRGSREDVVSLSPDAVKAMNARSFSITVPPEGGGASGAALPSGIDAAKLNPNYMLARIDYMEKHGDYMEKAFGLLRQTLSLPEDRPFFLGGAGNALLDKIAQKNGLTKPKVPEILRAAGEKDPFEDDSDADAGVIGIGLPNSGKELQVVFSRHDLASISAKAADSLKMVSLTDQNERSGPLLGTIKEGVLGRFTDTRPGQGANLWAVTDGGGPNARVVASVRSVGMDDVAGEVATGLLKNLKELFAKA